MKHLLVPLVLVLTSCQVLDKVLQVPQDDGTVVETTVGEVIADSSEPISDSVGAVVGGMTGNPMLAGGAAALLAGLLTTLRKKKS